MANDVTRLSIRAYAKLLDVSDGAVRKAIEKGKIKKGVAYVPQIKAGKEIEVPEIIKEIADKEWGFSQQTDKVKPGQNAVKKLGHPVSKIEDKGQKKSTHPGAYQPERKDEDTEYTEDEDKISQMTITSTMSYSEASRRREVIALVMDKKKLQELERQLIRRDEIENSLFAVGVELKKSLLNIPARMIAEIRSAPTDVEAQSMLTVEITNILEHISGLSAQKINGN